MVYLRSSLWHFQGNTEPDGLARGSWVYLVVHSHQLPRCQSWTNTRFLIAKRSFRLQLNNARIVAVEHGYQEFLSTTFIYTTVVPSDSDAGWKIVDRQPDDPKDWMNGFDLS